MEFIIFYILFLILSSGFRIIRNRATRNREGGVVYFKPIFTVQFWLYVAVLILTIVEFFVVSPKINLFVTLSGLIIYLAGIVGREWAIKTLGEYWSADIRIKEDHKLIKDGPYRYVRHPNLVCLLLETNGLCLIPNSYWTLIFVWTIYLFSILLRMYLEERALIEKFGQEYNDYKKEVFALLPIKMVKS
jgi:protein-S-isoprenylcysteine O-methyltransferase Ste14